MAKSDHGVVCDAGPLIHLDEIGCIDFLSGFTALLIPREVWEEAVLHRLNLEITKIPSAKIVEVPANESAKLRSLSSFLGLHAGERAALRLMEVSGATMLLCDDSTARVAAESLGYEVHGTIGLIIRSMRRAVRTRQQVVELLRELPRKSTLHLSSAFIG